MTGACLARRDAADRWAFLASTVARERRQSATRTEGAAERRRRRSILWSGKHTASAQRARGIAPRVGAASMKRTWTVQPREPVRLHVPRILRRVKL
jgi:hypothetical protein